MINASGTFDAIAAGGSMATRCWSISRLPRSSSKTITPEPRVGNEPQRIWETPAGMINSIGLPNRGLEGFVAEDLPRLAELPVPLIVSVMATSHEAFARLVEGVGGRDEVAAIELNVSCPNVHSGLIVGEQPTETAALMEALRPLTAKPLIVKLTPNVADPAAVAIAAEEGGADAVSLINTLKASAIDPASGRPGIAAGHGGLSGPAVRPDGGRPGAGRDRRDRNPRDRHGRGDLQAPTRSRCSTPGPGSSLSAPRASAIRWPAGGSPPSSRSCGRRGPSPIRNSTSTRGLGEFDGK